MSAVVRVSGKEHRLSLVGGHTITWRKASSGSNETASALPKEQIALVDVLSVLPTERGIRLQSRECPRGHPELTIFTFKKKKRLMRRQHQIRLIFAEGTECQRWCEKLQSALREISRRPRRLLVFVNPVGGRRKAPKIYNKRIAPLFDLAGIDADVVITQRANHALDMLEERDIRNLDGIICVGGDGMYHEVLNGLLKRTQADAGVSLRRSRFLPVTPRVSIGIIPAGSTDAMVYGLMGCVDPITSAIFVILGEQQAVDVASIVSTGRFLRFSSLACSYGFLGDILEHSETMRWLGPRRYDVAGVKCFLRNRGYRCKISYLPSKDTEHHPLDESRCVSGCVVCRKGMDEEECVAPPEKGASAMASSAEVSHPDGGDWREVEGHLTSVVACMSSLASPRSPRGLSPSAHFGDGCLDLIMVDHGSRISTLRQILKVSSNASHLSLPFVHVLRCREIRFRALIPDGLKPPDDEREFPEQRDRQGLPANLASRSSQSTHQPIDVFTDEDPDDSEANRRAKEQRQVLLRRAQSIWNVDGEIVKDAGIDIRVHRQLVKIYSRNVVLRDPQTGCFSSSYHHIENTFEH